MRKNVLARLTVTVVLIASSARAAEQVDSAIADLASIRSKAERLAATKWLQQSKDKDAIRAFGALRVACKDDDVDIRYESVLALGLLCEQHAQPCPLELVEAMLDPNDDIRATAAELVGLSNNVTDEAVPLLLKCAADPNADTRSQAVRALVRPATKDSLLLAVLHQAAYDRNVSVRSNAAAAIWKATDDLSQVVPHWLLLTKDSDAPAGDEGIPLTAANLAAMGAAKTLLEQGITRPCEMSDVLVKLVESNTAVLRRTAVRNLRAMAISDANSKRVLVTKRVPDLLRELRDDSDIVVATMAALGLKEFEQEPNAPMR